MAIVSYREVLPRTASHKFGEAPTAERKFVATVDAPTPTQTVVNAIGIFHGAVHPEFTFLKCNEINATEPDRHHIELTYRYELLKKESQSNPLARPDVWSFSIGGAKVPALFYYYGSGNDYILPLVNAAGDFIEGLESVEAEIKATINGNRAVFPLAIAAQVTNAINAAPYLGGAQYTWQCAGIGGQAATEVVNDVEIRYWQITVELVYRRSGWNLLVPNVGWNYFEGGEIKRAWVRDPETSEKITSGTPRALNAFGGLKAEGAAPDILGDGWGLRVHPAVDFSPYFGTPPF
jgi:hypothetical protein